MDDAQLTALVQTWQKRLEQQMAEQGVRRWCVEQAVKVTQYTGDFDATYRAIMKFISEPFADTFKAPE